MNSQTSSFELEVGDLVFIRSGSELFSQVASATVCWSNHVGVIIGHDGEDYLVAESRIPLSSTTHFQKFIARSEDKKYAVRRLPRALSRAEQQAIGRQAVCRKNKLYHLGFNLDSGRQFCSKFVYEVYREALSIELGRIETFDQLLHSNPTAHLKFWQVWFFGRIPWQRRTITPASLYFCPQLTTLIDLTNLSNSGAVGEDFLPKKDPVRVKNNFLNEFERCLMKA